MDHGLAVGTHDDRLPHSEFVAAARAVWVITKDKDDPKRRRPDITRAREILGWEPKIDLAEGLRRTIEFYRSKK